VSQTELALEVQDLCSRATRHEDERNFMCEEPLDWLECRGDRAAAVIAPQAISGAEDDQRDLG
jgi:hypothetical protein